MRLSSMLQAALLAYHKNQTQLETELAQCKASAASHTTAAAQVTAALHAELECLKQKLRDGQQHAEALKGREEEARSQSKQLATALTAAQVDYQVRCA